MFGVDLIEVSVWMGCFVVMSVGLIDDDVIFVVVDEVGY